METRVTTDKHHKQLAKKTIWEIWNVGWIGKWSICSFIQWQL